MNTTTINSNGKDSNVEKNKTAVAYTATAVGAAGAGVAAGATILSTLNDAEEQVTEVAVENPEMSEIPETTVGQMEVTGQPSSAATPSNPVGASPQTTTTTMAVEPEPITAENETTIPEGGYETSEVPAASVDQTTSTEHQSSTESTSASMSTSSEPATVDPNTVTTGDVPSVTEGEELIEEITATSETPVTEEVIVDPVEEPVNPDEIAEAIISETQIDPNDIDMSDVINFDEIGTVYTVDGESYTAATFHDAAGNNLVMVDVDGDNVFDIVTDNGGNIIADVPGAVTVDDAEMNIADNDSYLAHNDNENTDEFGADSIVQDIIA